MALCFPLEQNIHEAGIPATALWAVPISGPQQIFLDQLIVFSYYFFKFLLKKPNRVDYF